MKLTVTLFAAVLLCATTATAQQIRFTNFSAITNLRLNGTAKQASYGGQKVLRLTDGVPVGGGSHRPEAASTFFTIKQPVANGFTTYFAFQMHNSTPAGPAEGIAFLVQNSQSTDHSMGATGAGTTALGAGADATSFGGMGYAGIYNSLAVEFDIAQQSWDPNSNHAAIQSCGSGVNTPVHLPGTYTIGQNHDVTSCLVSANAVTNTSHLADGAVHQVVIEYTPGTLQVWLDPQFIVGTHTPLSTSPPILNIPYTIDGLSLDDGKALVGFTASQSVKVTAQDVLAWEFTPHTPITIQQQIPNGGIPNPFVFGGHDAIVTYPPDFVANGDFMTVTATPVDPGVFYHTRLFGTQFANEDCIVYLETGGNCIVYSVTCQAPDKMTPVPCPSELTPTILLSTSFYTAEPVTNQNADFLKADPIGTNNWITICNGRDEVPPCYDPNVFDGTTSGKGKDLSDLVATFVDRNRSPGQQLGAAEPRRRVTIEAKR